jgi:hypothetical protein
MVTQRVSNDLRSALDQISNLHQLIKQQGSQAFHDEDYDAVARYKDAAEEILTFKKNLSTLIDSWANLLPGLSETLKETRGFPERDDRFKDSVTIKLTDGNLNNSYILLNRYTRMFPEDAFGKRSKEEGIGKQVTLFVDGLSEPVKTDIDGKRKYFRDRKWVRKFFEIHRLKPGDRIVIERIAKYAYRVYVPEE